MIGSRDTRSLMEALGRDPGLLRPGTRVLGIDLGTTNSAAASVHFVRDSARPVLAGPIEVEQRTREGIYISPILPSMVALHDSEAYVGEGAKRLRSEAPRYGLVPYQSLFYDCKNEIGLRKTYHKAPPGYCSAADIGAKVLGLLHDAASPDDAPFDRVVVTVPASFQGPQRADTIRAARLAGLELTNGELLDEPLAAFFDYFVLHQADLLEVLDNPRSLVVFDFGGGTCDVAVFRLSPPSGGPGLRVEPLAVSRYHRLGGGDIDAAIVHRVLVPELCRQNEVSPLDLTYADKKRVLEPALLGTAEALKISLCSEMQRLRAFGKLTDDARADLRATQPMSLPILWRGQQLLLERPTLEIDDFDDILEPFLDQDFLYARETEYLLTCSIFAPLSDALDRAGVRAGDVDLCLLVGGSSLIPQVADEVSKFLEDARVLAYEDAGDVKSCVSRGAAYHALSLATFGEGLVVPSAGDDICLRHQDGHAPLILQGTALPFPADGSYAERSGLAFPDTVQGDVVLVRVELSSSDHGRVLYAQRVDMGGPVQARDPLRLEYRMDANQVLHMRFRKEGDSVGQARHATIESPLTNLVNPQSAREQIEEIEEDLRTRRPSAHESSSMLQTLAYLYSDLGQKEKAVEYLRRAMRLGGGPDEEALCRLARIHGELGDTDREDKAFQEALDAGSWTGTRFNYALALRRRGEDAQAWDIIHPTLNSHAEPPFLVLGALLREKLDDPDAAVGLLDDALQRFEPVPALDDWSLGWFVTAASMRRDDAALAAGREEQRRRASRGGRHTAPDPGGALPILNKPD